MFVSDEIRKRFITTVDIVPPKSEENAWLEKTSAAARHADFLNVSDIENASSSIEAAKLLEDAGIKTITHIAARDRSRAQLKGMAETASDHGLENFLCMTGKNGSNVSVFEVIEMLKENAACVGCVANPYAADMERETERLKIKALSGADFVITQPVFDIADAEDFAAKSPLPVIFGVPMLNSDWARIFKGLDIHVPDFYENGVSNEEYSLSFAGQMLQKLRGGFSGAYLMPHGMEHRLAEVPK